METEKILEITKQARQTSGQVWLKGYCSSEGRLTDVRLALRPASFYGELIEEAIDWLHKLHTAELFEPYLNEIALTAGTTAEMVRTTAGQLMRELELKIVARETDGGSSRFAHDQDVNVEPITWEACYLRNVEKLEEVVISEPPIKIKKARATTPEQLATRELKARWPICRYGAQYKLQAGKFVSLYAAT